MTFAWTFFEFLLCCFDSYFILSVPSYQLGAKKEAKKLFLYIYGTILALLMMYNFFNVDVTLILFVALLVYTFAFLEGKFTDKLFWALFPFMLLGAIDMFVGAAIINFVNIPFKMLGEHNWYRLLYIFIAKSIEVIALYAFRKSKKRLASFSFLGLVTATLIPTFTTLAVSFSVLTRMDNVETSSKLIIFITTTALISLYSVMLVILGHMDKKYKNAVLSERLAMQTQNQQDLLNALYEFRSNVIYHLHHIWIITKKYKIDDLDEIMHEITLVNQSLNNLRKTGVDSVDAVLASKITKARHDQIFLEIESAPIPENIFDETDLSAILNNIIDFAMDEILIGKRDNTQKLIDIIMQTEGDIFGIVLKYKTEDIVGTHAIESHGGLIVAKKLVERNNGELLITRGAYNQITVIVPSQKSKESKLYDTKNRIFSRKVNNERFFGSR